MDRTTTQALSLSGTDIPEVVDLRGLEAPEPMEKILMAAAQLGPDDVFLARLPHTPYPLFPLLEARGLAWQVHEESDQNVVILIRRKL